MRWLIVAACAVATATAARAQGPDALLCSAAARNWDAVRQGSDLKAMDRVIKAIGPHCAEVVGANRRRAVVARAAAAMKTEAPRAQSQVSAMPAPAPASRRAAASSTDFAPHATAGFDDDASVLRSLEIQADAGDAGAQRGLGALYYNGQGAPQSYALALYWFRKAADQGDAAAENQLGVMYGSGRGAPRDPGAAALWYRKAAMHGDGAAELNLGLLYHRGDGVPRDYAEAAAWYRRAAARGNAAAQYNLGLLYDAGHGVPQDHATAVGLWRQAARGGSVDALSNLGAAYALGAGVPVDNVEAYKWFELAASRYPPGDTEDRQDALRNRDIVAARMTAAEVAAARRQAQGWTPSQMRPSSAK